MKKALCVGINDYPNSYNDLNGCVNDANDWKGILESFDMEVYQLLDEWATRENILTSLNELVLEAKEGDVVVFTYSGHGTQVKDYSNDEVDALDEALYVYDEVILDDELREIFDKLHPEATLYVVLDSCFSGTATRMAYVPLAKPKYVITDLPKGVINKRFLEEANMVELLLTGSSDREYSYDAYLDGRYNGAMTYYALRAIEQNKEATWEEFYETLRLALPSTSFPQTPQLEGKEEDKQKKLFTGKETIEEPPVVEIPTNTQLIVFIVVVGFLVFLIIYLPLQ